MGRGTRRQTEMKPVLTARRSNLILLAKSFPPTDRRSSTGVASRVDDAAKEGDVVDATLCTRKISQQCAGVAQISRVSATGLPPRPRLIVTPPTSPRNTSGHGPEVYAAETAQQPQAVTYKASPSPEPKKAQSPQPFKILSHSPRKLVIEIEKVDDQIEGLLTQHFARQNSADFQLASPTVQDLTTTLLRDDVIQETGEECLAICGGRRMERSASTASRDSAGQSLPSSVKSTASCRKQQAIEILKAKKAKQRETEYSKESVCSVNSTASRCTANYDGHINHTSRRREKVVIVDNTSDASDAETNDASLPRTLVCSSLARDTSFGGSSRLESMTSVSSTSSFTAEAEKCDISVQTYRLLRQNSRRLGRDPTGLGAIIQHPSIEEESSADSSVSTVALPREIENKPVGSPALPPMEMWNPNTTVSAEKPVHSAFAAAADKPLPKPQRTRPTALDALALENSTLPFSPPETQDFEESPKERKVMAPKKPPPPPPKPRKIQEAVNKPPPPSKSHAKGKTGKAPPPPPPGDKKKNGKNGNGICRNATVISMFREVRKISKGSASVAKHKKSKSSKSDASKLESQGSGGENMIKELERKSSHFAQIQTDVETHGPTINKMIQDINTRKFETMSEMNCFVKEVDRTLGTFADETAVLKHFEWPNRFYMYREALALWTELNNAREKCRNWARGNREITIELDKMKRHMERNIRRMDELQRTMEVDVKKFQRNGIPWDSTVLQKAHDGTMTLLDKYMQIVFEEVNRSLTRSNHKERNIEILTDTVKLTFKIHQSVGGLTESCTTLFEKIAALTRSLTDL